MPLWGKTDAPASKPKFGNQATKFFVSLEESRLASNRAAGLGTPGWYDVVNYTDSQGVARTKVELLVPMKVTNAVSGDAADDTVVKDV